MKKYILILAAIMMASLLLPVCAFAADEPIGNVKLRLAFQLNETDTVYSTSYYVDGKTAKTSQNGKKLWEVDISNFKSLASNGGFVFENRFKNDNNGYLQWSTDIFELRSIAVYLPDTLDLLGLCYDYQIAGVTSLSGNVTDIPVSSIAPKNNFVSCLRSATEQVNAGDTIVLCFKPQNGEVQLEQPSAGSTKKTMVTFRNCYVNTDNGYTYDVGETWKAELPIEEYLIGRYECVNAVVIKEQMEQHPITREGWAYTNQWHDFGTDEKLFSWHDYNEPFPDGGNSWSSGLDKQQLRGFYTFDGFINMNYCRYIDLIVDKEVPTDTISKDIAVQFIYDGSLVETVHKTYTIPAPKNAYEINKLTVILDYDEFFNSTVINKERYKYNIGENVPTKQEVRFYDLEDSYTVKVTNNSEQEWDYDLSYFYLEPIPGTRREFKLIRDLKCLIAFEYSREDKEPWPYVYTAPSPGMATEEAFREACKKNPTTKMCSSTILNGGNMILPSADCAVTYIVAVKDSQGVVNFFFITIPNTTPHLDEKQIKEGMISIVEEDRGDIKSISIIKGKCPGMVVWDEAVEEGNEVIELEQGVFDYKADEDADAYTLKVTSKDDCIRFLVWYRP